VEFDPVKLKESLKPKYHADRAGDDMPIMIQQLVNGEVHGAWDINCAASLILNEQFVAWPTHNMVDNTGLLVGTHANGQAPPWELAWEKRYLKGVLRLPATITEQPRIRSAFLQFFFYHLSPDASIKKLVVWQIKRPLVRGLFHKRKIKN